MISRIKRAFCVFIFLSAALAQYSAPSTVSAIPTLTVAPNATQSPSPYPTATPPPTYQPSSTPNATVQPSPYPTAPPTVPPTWSPPSSTPNTTQPAPTAYPTVQPTQGPTSPSTVQPTQVPTVQPTPTPTSTVQPTPTATVAPTSTPNTTQPTPTPSPSTVQPTQVPTVQPTASWTPTPTSTVQPTPTATVAPTSTPNTTQPTPSPSTVQPTPTPTWTPTVPPTVGPTPPLPTNSTNPTPIPTTAPPTPTSTPTPTISPNSTSTPQPTPGPEGCYCPSGYQCRVRDDGWFCSQDCYADEQCSPGYICVNTACVPDDRDCAVSSDCNVGYICRTGKCRPDETGGPDVIPCDIPATCGQCQANGDAPTQCCPALAACCSTPSACCVNGFPVDSEECNNPPTTPDVEPELPPPPPPGPSGCPAVNCDMSQFPAGMNEGAKLYALGINGPVVDEDEPADIDDMATYASEFDLYKGASAEERKRGVDRSKCNEAAMTLLVNALNESIAVNSPGCKIKKFVSVPESCTANVDFVCNSTEAIFKTLANSTVGRYVNTFFRYQMVPFPGQKRPTPYKWNVTADSAATFWEQNNDLTINNFRFPSVGAKPYHLQAMAQGRAPIRGTKRPNYYGTPGVAYVLDTGVDAYHPEFLDENGVSRVINEMEAFSWSTKHRVLKKWFDPFHDQFGHGTMVAAMIAGKTMGVAPKALIKNYKIVVQNAEDCLYDPNPKQNGAPENPESGRDGKPSMYPAGSAPVCNVMIREEYVNALISAKMDILTRRKNGDGASVIVNSFFPSYPPIKIPSCKANGVNGGHCLSGVTNAIRGVIASGIVFVQPAGNAGLYIEHGDDQEWLFTQAMDSWFAPWLWEVPEITLVGGMYIDLDKVNTFSYGVWRMEGIDDTGFNITAKYGKYAKVKASNYGPAIDFYAPVTGWPYWPMITRNRHRTFNRNPYYWHNNYMSGTSFAAPQVAGGLLAYLSTQPATTTAAQALAAANEWAVNHEVPLFDTWIEGYCLFPNETGTGATCSTVNPCNATNNEICVDPIDPATPGRPRILNDITDFGDWSGTIDMKVFRLIPSENLNPTQEWVNPNADKPDYYHNTSNLFDPYWNFSQKWGTFHLV